MQVHNKDALLEGLKDLGRSLDYQVRPFSVSTGTA